MTDANDRNEPENENRRTFLKTSALAVAALPVASLLTHRTVKAMPQAEDGHAHNYVNDGADSDHADYSDGERCDNCVFWGGEEDNGWGTCNHPDFAGVLVRDKGWCDAWVG